MGRSEGSPGATTTADALGTTRGSRTAKPSGGPPCDWGRVIGEERAVHELPPVPPAAVEPQLPESGEVGGAEAQVREAERHSVRIARPLGIADPETGEQLACRESRHGLTKHAPGSSGEQVRGRRGRT
ncbi:MAG: hypothetical protein M3P48_04450 [Actinomycetota bacterium]|nr:hypothetical protein [Actinomycetota bacterium]